MKNKILKVYDILYNSYGPQGWWPLINLGYHPLDYSIPRNDKERFEIILGAILTQNTSWRQAEKALFNLYKNDLISPERILNSDDELIKRCIRPSGYFNQKLIRIREISKFFLKKKEVSRDELLGIKGIGKETADSILLYAYKKPIFVIDAYTRRIFSRLGIIDGTEEYDEIRKKVELAIPKDYRIYQEYHALIVEHAKSVCKLKPSCDNCILKKYCIKTQFPSSLPSNH